jgi:flagellar protein FliO/FliZ
MWEYILRLFILIPLVGGMAWGSLWLWRKAQLGMLGIPGLARLSLPNRPERKARLVDVVPMGPGSKIVVIDFGDKELLVAVSRSQVSLLSEREKGDFHA